MTRSWEQLFHAANKVRKVRMLEKTGIVAQQERLGLLPMYGEACSPLLQPMLVIGHLTTEYVRLHEHPRKALDGRWRLEGFTGDLHRQSQEYFREALVFLGDDDYAVLDVVTIRKGEGSSAGPPSKRGVSNADEEAREVKQR